MKLCRKCNQPYKGRDPYCPLCMNEIYEEQKKRNTFPKQNPPQKVPIETSGKHRAKEKAEDFQEYLKEKLKDPKFKKEYDKIKVDNN